MALDEVRRLIAPLSARITQLENEVADNAAKIGEACVPLSARITQLETEVADNAAKYNQDVLIFAPEHICNVAAQILLFYCGDKPNEYPPSFHVNRMNEGRKWQFHDAFGGKLDGSSISCSTEVWMNKFDRLIQNRNNRIHFRDWNALERNVIQIRGLFLRHPNLPEMLEDEHYVIQKFEDFRASPLRDDPVAQRRRK
jgi:hypothetical protein